MANWYPERVEKIVYLDAGYEWGDFKPSVDHWPVPLPLSFASYAAYRESVKNLLYPEGIPDGAEADIRAWVIDQPDGTVREVADDSTNAEIMRAFQAERRDYRSIRAPALAIYASDFLPSGGYADTLQARVRAWNDEYYRPFRAAQMARIRSEVRGISIVEVTGTHLDFIWRSHEQVLQELMRFLIP
jgi:pimeloyl-ACP methyl ester carboxylesterase